VALDAIGNPIKAAALSVAMMRLFILDLPSGFGSISGHVLCRVEIND